MSSLSSPLASGLGDPPGSGEWVGSGTVLEYEDPPVAIFSSSPQYGVLGSVVKLDGRGSINPDGGPLTFAWKFLSVPVGSKVQSEGFRVLDADGDLVSFSPDMVGEYVIQLVVSNGVFSSAPAISTMSIRALLVPHGRNLVPDGKFIWSYIRDVWTQVEGREWFETLWSTLIQLVGNEMLKLYQTDFNKSIRDIQDLYQQRWLSYEPKLLLEQSSLSFYLGHHFVGSDAITGAIGATGLAVILRSNEVIIYSGALPPSVSGEKLSIETSLSPSNVGSFVIESLNANRTGLRLYGAPLNPASDTIASATPVTFEFQSKNWTIDDATAASNTREGDILFFASGANAGFYRIVTKSGAAITVDKKPPSSSNPSNADIYRPVNFRIAPPAEATTDIIAMGLSTAEGVTTLTPGRLITVGDQCFTVSRAAADSTQRVPLAIVTVDRKVVPSGLKSQFWRTPHTLVSETQSFEDLGVNAGDRLVAEVVLHGVEKGVDVALQVVGVDRNRLGFVLTDAEVVAGQVPPIPNKTYLDLSSELGIPSVSKQQDGTLLFSSSAAEILDVLESGRFARTYLNQELTTSSEISVSGAKFTLRPKYVVRNRLVPVEETLRSVPVLQSHIVQPTVVERDGKVFQIHKDVEYEIPRKPSLLTENFDFIVDAEYALDGELTFRSGESLLEADDGDFIDRGVEAGDTLVIDEPITLQGEYPIEAVIDRTRIQLARKVPKYVISDFVTAKVYIKRRRSGHFLRFTPGTFTAANPAPDRLWGEVSFFDNSQNIENNFGILVALKKADLESISTGLNYRQAVAGLMFAYTKGSSIERIRLGVQILLGLPFSEHRGIIRSIEEDYRLDIYGTPVLGRILVEDVSSTEEPLGTQRVYTYPVDLQSDLAGIETNPATGKKYVVGDIVELFRPLAKGVKIDDYVSAPFPSSFSPETFLQQYHSIRVSINDNIFGLDELALVSNFLKKITPAYIAYSIVMAADFVDTVNITDVLRAGFKIDDGILVDNASMSIASPLMFDSTSFGQRIPLILGGEGVFWVRRFGTTLETNGNQAVLSEGGFLNARANERFQAPLVKAGDTLVIREGLNAGMYPITSVLSDTTVQVSGTSGFVPLTGQKFYVQRRITHKFGSGTTTATSGDATINVGSLPLRTDGVAPGDWVILHDAGSSSRHIVRVVKEQTSGSGTWNELELVPAPSSTGAKSFVILRPVFLPTGVDQYVVESDGSNKLLDGDMVLRSVAQPGDGLRIVGDQSEFEYVLLDPKNLYTAPPMPAGIHDVLLMRLGHGGVENIGWDHLENFAPRDEVDVTLSSSTADITCTASSATVTFAGHNPLSMGFLPGDFLVVGSGSNSTVDVGYGPGVYPIVQVTSSTVVTSLPLTASDTATWKILRRT